MYFKEQLKQDIETYDIDIDDYKAILNYLKGKYHIQDTKYIPYPVYPWHPVYPTTYPWTPVEYSPTTAPLITCETKTNAKM